MTVTSPTSPTTTPRLRTDVGLWTVADGHVLRVGRNHHRVHLDDLDAEALLDALADGGNPDSDRARRALDALTTEGLVDPPPPRRTVVGTGPLAAAARGALARAGIDAGDDDDGPLLVAADDPAPGDLPTDPGSDACWRTGDLVLLAPPAVSAHDVAARRAAATRHRDHDPALRPVPGGRRLAGPVSPAGLHLAAAVVAAELLRPDRAPYDAVAVDLLGLTVTRHPVLPVPPAPA
ncbi:hypothetical protein [Nocardioides litoris]|uniref:hypothetical protein n=1 Tax=Nocardioides litoris TaxID=1926648 RepID=UPI00111F1543|nr:hypothetical protein [Nocardioides litoris]